MNLGWRAQRNELLRHLNHKWKTNKKNPGIPFNNLFGKENLNKWWGFLWAARFISHFP